MFPKRKVNTVSDYFADYVGELKRVYDNVDIASLEAVASLIEDAIQEQRTIYCFGNGGSAALASSFQVDMLKSASAKTGLRPNIRSLSAEISTLTAVGNDIGYDEVFAFQLELMVHSSDLVIAISSSGNSPNIIRGLAAAKKNNAITVLICGFDKGRSVEYSDVVLHAPAENYGICEDLHQSFIHIISQFIRMKFISGDLSDHLPF